jgi:L-cysteine desulfidase
VSEIRSLLQSEIVEVAGCTEPASVAFAFLRARRHLNGPFDPRSVKAQLYASAEVLRNASTAVIPLLNRRGLRTVVAAGLSSKADQFNLFPGIDQRITHILLRRRSWLKVGRTAQHQGIYVKAVLLTPTESVSVVIQGRHDEVRTISHNGKTIFRSPPHRQPSIRMPQIMQAVAKRDRRMEEVAREFIVQQVRGDPAQPLPERIAALIRARMCGSSSPVMTVTGSGNHGILLGVPFYELYRKHGRRILPAALFSLLAVIHMTGKRSRISADCGLATKAAPALAAGLAFAQGANLAQITRVMRSVSQTVPILKCSGARASCGRKARQVLGMVLAEVEAGTHSNCRC